MAHRLSTSVGMDAATLVPDEDVVLELDDLAAMFGVLAHDLNPVEQRHRLELLRVVSRR